MLWSQPKVHAVLSCVVSWITSCLHLLYLPCPLGSGCLSWISRLPLFLVTLLPFIGDRGRSCLMAALFLQAVTFELCVPGGLYEIALWQQLGNAGHYGLRKPTTHPCLSAALGREDCSHQSCLLTAASAVPWDALAADWCAWKTHWSHGLGWLGSGSSGWTWSFSFGFSFLNVFFSLPWLPLPIRTLCLLLLWKLSLQLSMALWKEVLHLRELTCPQDFCSRWVCGCAALSSWWGFFPPL